MWGVINPHDFSREIFDIEMVSGAEYLDTNAVAEV